MSVLNPERVPVKVYRWDDSNAPKLDKSANCMATILKACLVTGYGSKQGAGWTLPYEDLSAGIKVLRPPVSAEQDFYLKLSADTGQEITSQVYLDMTAINNGNLKLQCATPFNYGKGTVSGKWVVIATSRSIWLLVERAYGGGSPKAVQYSGSWFYCGDVSKNNKGNRAIYLHHSGDTDRDGSNVDILQATTDSGQSLVGKIMDNVLATNNTYPLALFDGKNTLVDDLILAPLYIMNNKFLYQLPGIYVPSSGAKNDNFIIKNISSEGGNSDFMVMDMNAYNVRSNFYFKLDDWVF